MIKKIIIVVLVYISLCIGSTLFVDFTEPTPAQVLAQKPPTPSYHPKDDPKQKYPPMQNYTGVTPQHREPRQRPQQGPPHRRPQQRPRGGR